MRNRMLSAALLTVLAVSFVPSHAIVGGSTASTGEYPWMAAIYTGSRPSSGQYCGGSLVSPTVVVTAAHCMSELLDNAFATLPDLLGFQVKVMLGETRLNGTGGERIPARRITVHPDSDIDVAIIELTRASAQAPIDWVRPSQSALYAAGVNATITGWGLTSEGGSGSNQLLEATVPIVSDASCASSYGSSIVAATMVCAGYPQGGVDTCQGDSGGPMMVPGPQGRLVLAGATSFGEGCARPGYPGVYAEIAAASAFIEQFV